MFWSYTFIALLTALARVAAWTDVLPPIPKDLSTPVQQRVAYDGPTGMTIGWNTFQQVEKPTIYYGLTPSTLLDSASSQISETYPTSRTWANTVHLSGLLPSTKYYYKIDSTNSTVQSFKTAPIAGDLAAFTVALVADMGVFGPDGLSTRNKSYTGISITDPLKPGEHTTIDRLVADSNSYEFIIHPGDFSYADAWLKEINLDYINESVSQPQGLIYEGLNEQFFNQLSAVSATKPYMVGVGNHEANCLNGGYKSYSESTCPIGQTNFTGFINRFAHQMPDSSAQPFHERLRAIRTRSTGGNLAVPPFWYSYDYGMTHFVVFDTETDLGVGLIGPEQLGGGMGSNDGPFGTYMNQQLDFLKSDLAKVDRNKTPWVIAAGHRPWYGSDTGPCYVCQQAFEPIFNTYKVDVVVQGHVHNMQRMMPISNNVTDPNGLNNPTAPLYIINGAAGHFEGLNPLPKILPPYVAFANDAQYGYSKLLFKDRQHLEVQAIRSDTGEVIDSAILYKQH